MNDQVMPPTPAGGGERSASVRPEDLQAVPSAEAGSAPASPEVAPAPGSSPAPPPAPAASTAPKMSRDDVVAAIAAMPGGANPPGSTSTVPTPATAADVDVIEPEWVDKAEDVIKTHAGDPYGEEEGIEQLQEDYLQKRYGISVKDADNKGGSGSKPKGA